MVTDRKRGCRGSDTPTTCIYVGISPCIELQWSFLCVSESILKHVFLASYFTKFVIRFQVALLINLVCCAHLETVSFETETLAIGIARIYDWGLPLWCLFCQCWCRLGLLISTVSFVCFLSKYLILSINIAVSDMVWHQMSHMETLCRHGTQQWKNTVLLEFVIWVRFQCILFYFFMFLICGDCAVL